VKFGASSSVKVFNLGMLTPPSLFLPPIKEIPTCPPSTLSSHIASLGRIFIPRVHGTGLAISQGEEVESQISTDPFERSYSIRWLTALISLSDRWEGQQSTLFEIYQQVLQDASQVLALFSGPSSVTSFFRNFIFTLGKLETDAGLIHPPPSVQVELRDLSIDSQDFSSVGNQTWGSSCILAELIALRPGDYLPSAYQRLSIRILELGAGTGLVSLTIAKILSLFPTINAEVIATDFHPAVLANLLENTRRNFPSRVSTLSVRPLDWSSFINTKRLQREYGLFELILGADIVYEADHAAWIKSCVEICLAKPEGEDLQDQPSFQLLIPLRRTHKEESGMIEMIFGLVKWVRGHSSLVNWTLGILSVKDIFRRVHSDNWEDITYRHYRIGWGVV